MEFDENAPHPVICLLDEQQKVTKKGGTMRLGAKPCQLQRGTVAHQVYGTEQISERHRHRFEFNNEYRDQLTKAGLVVSGRYTEFDLVEMIELRDHPYFVACQFHPEFQSKPWSAHPLFRGFIAAALKKAQA
jgi:CTP synthase